MKMRCFLEEFTQLIKLLHDRRSRRSRQIPSLGGRGFFMTNVQFLLVLVLSYVYKNTVGAVAHLFFSDPPFAPHANLGRKSNISNAKITFPKDCKNILG